LWYWDLNSGSSPWATPPALFLWWVFQAMVSWTVCPGWLLTMILLISAFWVARIMGMCHQWRLAWGLLNYYFLIVFLHPILKPHSWCLLYKFYVNFISLYFFA
jgi:hypothetical protein